MGLAAAYNHVLREHGAREGAATPWILFLDVGVLTDDLDEAGRAQRRAGVRAFVGRVWEGHWRNALFFADLGGPPGRGRDYAMFAVSRMGSAALGGFDENFIESAALGLGLDLMEDEGTSALFLCDHWRRLRISGLPFVRVPVAGVVGGGRGDGDEAAAAAAAEDIFFALDAEGEDAGGEREGEDAGQQSDKAIDSISRAHRIRRSTALSIPQQRRRRKEAQGGNFWPFRGVPEEGRSFYARCDAARAQFVGDGARRVRELARRR